MPDDVFRSAPMCLVQLYVPREAARAAMAMLGRLAVVHLRDLNEGVGTASRPFMGEMRRIEDALRTVASLEHDLEESGVLKESQRYPNFDVLSEPLGAAAEVDDLLDHVRIAADKIAHLVNAQRSLAKRRDRLLEQRHVLRSAGRFFAQSPSGGHKGSAGRRSRPRRDDIEPLLDNADITDPLELEEELQIYDDGDLDTPEADPEDIGGEVVAGAVAEERYGALERLCWRAARGNLVMSSYIDEKLPNTAFLLFTHGSATALKMRKLAEAMDAHLVAVRPSSRARRAALDETNERLAEVFAVLDSTSETLEAEATSVCDQLGSWKAVLLKERLLYSALSKFEFDSGRRTLIGEGWVPRDDVALVQDELRILGSADAQIVLHEIRTSRTPPTYHYSNKLTAAFQAMVDIYGISRYQEVNPGLPTVITFPFMFAVMFGDIGHGLILTGAALVLVLKERQFGRMRRDEIFDMAFSGRYVLLLMGLFSIYTGILYNDIFSRALTLFSSGWQWPHDFKEGDTIQATFKHHAYPLGIDWAWHGADNALAFTNSYKMKLSVLMGFAHMTYSLFFSLVNARFFESPVDIWGNFVPGFLFMQSIFGYLSITIIYKWTVDWIGQGREPPPLLNMLINMFLSPGTIDVPLYSGQKWIQYLLVLIALVCVPWLLITKPLVLYRRNKKAQAEGYADLHAQESETSMFAIEEEAGDDFEIHDHTEKEHFDLSEIVVHQVIHTIEFCLNCVSHTASYLRLWALSLAHSQLSSVLWSMTLANAFGPTGFGGVVTVVFLFGLWFVITLMVLVGMEGVSAMLHALRLHWVEAMSKHFEGEGYAFEAFDFTKV